MEDKVIEWENTIIRFMDRFNVFSIPLYNDKMLEKRYSDVISGNGHIFLLCPAGYVLYQEAKLSVGEKEGICKYVIWYCNNMLK